MKNQYRVKRITLKPNMTMDEYWKAVNNASIKYCNGLDEVRTYCGGKLHKQRNGYSGINGNIEYVAEKISQ
jgi:hypothetical protein